MNRIILAIFAVVPVLMFAQNADITILTQNEALANPGACGAADIDQIAPYPFFEETYQIPAFSLYDEYWDTSHLRSRAINIPFSNDRLMLMLVQDANNPFAMPCRFENVKTKYGPTKKGDFHPGIDLQTESQTLVKSCFDGLVRVANSYGSYGNMVVVRHYNGLETVYAHLGKLCVKTGQFVNAGQVIGQMGTPTGSALCNLHFETRLLNEPFDPELIIDFEEEDILQNNIALMSRDFNIVPVDSVKARKTQTQPSTAKSSAKPELDAKQPTAAEVQKPAEAAPAKPAAGNAETNAQQNTEDTVYHTVKPGENLYRISLKYNTTVEKILQLNNLPNADRIVEGQRLRVR